VIGSRRWAGAFAISQMQLFRLLRHAGHEDPRPDDIPVAALRVGLYALFYFVLPATLFGPA